MPLMRRVAKRTEIRVVRSKNDDATAASEQAVKLFHGANDIADMLNDVHGPHFAKGAVREWEGELIQVGDDVCSGVQIPINADRTRILVIAAADIQNTHGSSVAMRGEFGL